MSEIIRKITVNGVCGKLDFKKFMEFEQQNPGQTLWMLQVYGIARRARPVNGDLNPYVHFSGEFEAINLGSGQVYNSGGLILPGVAQDLLFGAVGDGINLGVQFGIKLGVKYREDAATKYVYVCESTLKAARNDQLGLLRDAIQRGVEAPALTYSGPPAPAGSPAGGELVDAGSGSTQGAAAQAAIGTPRPRRR